MNPRYRLSEERKKQYAGVYLLEYMINRPASFDLLLSEDDSDLESILENLLVKGYVDIKDKAKYVPTQEGRAVLQGFLERYTEYLNVFDVYCALDLEAGEFAFAHYFDLRERDTWKEFLNDDRWDDLRIAVAECKKMDPIEVVFMSFIAEGRFGRDHTGWQFDLLLGSVWDEIMEICNAAIHYQELGYTDGDEEISPEQVIEDIICQGAELMIELHEKDAKLARPIEHADSNGSNIGDDAEEEYVVEEVIVEDWPVSDYYGYRDPYYLSPGWRRPWIF